MIYLKKNYIFFLLAILIFFAHQIIFQDFFPNKNLNLGNDYSQFIPNFIFGKIWFHKNFLSVPWFSPSFCCGIPFFGDPQTMYYTIQQLFFIIFSPIIALKLIFLFFSFIGFVGTFLLINKSFKKNIYIALIASSLFLFNGFVNYRLVIGSVVSLNYIFIPLYCYLVINSFYNNENKKTSFFFIIISGLLLSHIIQSTGGPIAIITILSIIFITLLHVYFFEKIQIFYHLFFSFLVGFLISSSKIIASLSLLNNFPRENPPIFFESYYDLISNVFRSLFFYPDSQKFNLNVINSLPYKMEVHELEFGITIVPLIIFLLFFINIKKFKFPKFSPIKLIALLAMFLLLVFAGSINVLNDQLGIIFRELPLIKSNWVNFRFLAIFILPIIIIVSFIIDKIILTENKIKMFALTCLLIIFFQNYFYKKDYYHKQNYKTETIQEFYYDKNRLKNIKVKNIVIITDKNKKPLINLQRNNLFIHELSPMFCYNTLYGYNLEALPQNFIFNKLNEVNENLFYYTGDPKLVTNDKLNFFDPSCFVYPNENNCKPGDLFDKSKINQLENLLNYKSYDFKLSFIQKIFNFINVFSIIFSIFYIIYYIYYRFGAPGRT